MYLKDSKIKVLFQANFIQKSHPKAKSSYLFPREDKKLP